MHEDRRTDRAVWRI